MENIKNYFLNIQHTSTSLCATSVNPFRLSQENVAALTKSFHATLHPEIYIFFTLEMLVFFLCVFLFLRISNCTLRCEGISKYKTYTQHMV